ncbi:hypothetical protein Tco_0705538 [Tanacetum coccineum]|uniref:Uncharacterized protein n=1 Tax=Tanacetum coccineum TaxID=301880 RepID=A0ABQ4Y6C2_9ASTR
MRRLSTRLFPAPPDPDHQTNTPRCYDTNQRTRLVADIINQTAPWVLGFKPERQPCYWLENTNRTHPWCGCRQQTHPPGAIHPTRRTLSGLSPQTNAPIWADPTTLHTPVGATEKPHAPLMGGADGGVVAAVGDDNGGMMMVVAAGGGGGEWRCGVASEGE